LFTGEIIAPYRRQQSPNPFPVINIWPEVVLTQLPHMHMYYLHKSHQERCHAPEMTASL